MEYFVAVIQYECDCLSFDNQLSIHSNTDSLQDQRIKYRYSNYEDLLALCHHLGHPLRPRGGWQLPLPELPGMVSINLLYILLVHLLPRLFLL